MCVSTIWSQKVAHLYDYEGIPCMYLNLGQSNLTTLLEQYYDLSVDILRKVSPSL